MGRGPASAQAATRLAATIANPTRRAFDMGWLRAVSSPILTDEPLVCRHMEFGPGPCLGSLICGNALRAGTDGQTPRGQTLDGCNVPDFARSPNQSYDAFVLRSPVLRSIA